MLDANTVRTVLGMLQGPKIDNDAWVHDIGIEEDDEGIHITVTVGADERPNVPIAEAKQDIYTRLGARPDAVVHISLNQPPIRRIVARVEAVPGYGWQPFVPAPLAHPVDAHEQDGTVVLSNGLLTVEVDAAVGTFSLNGRPGYGRLVDGGDLGDSYNYSPPRRDVLIDDTGLRLGAGARARPGARPRHHHRRLRVARPCRRVLAGAGRRAPGGGRDPAGAESRRARSCGWPRPS